MSFEPVTLWTPRCDGDTTTGQCPELYHVRDDEDGEPDQVTLWQPHLAQGWVSCLTSDGWLFTGKRLLCPAHVAAAEHLAAAAVDGLPLIDELQPFQRVETRRSVRVPQPPRLWVLVGAPATGKTTWCIRNKPRVGTVLSLDRARAVVGAGEEDQSVTPEAVDLVRHQAGQHLAAGKTVTIDATGAVITDRATWLEVAAHHQARAFAVVFRVPLHIAIHRNASRYRSVPTAVITRMWNRIHATTAADLLAEGFHAVTELSTEEPS